MQKYKESVNFFRGTENGVGNIDEGMTKIENMLEKVITAFQQQLDSLFENDVVDITAEIRVMEKMMASEGLAGTNDFK